MIKNNNGEIEKVFDINSFQIVEIILPSVANTKFGMCQNIQ